MLDRLRVSRPGPPDPGGLRGRAARAVRPALALVTIAAALVSAWAIWQPLRSDQESDAALYTISLKGVFCSIAT